MEDDALAVPTQDGRIVDIDENGVDLAQVRAMLALTPAERLDRMARFMGALLKIRALNEDRRST